MPTRKDDCLLVESETTTRLPSPWRAIRKHFSGSVALGVSVAFLLLAIACITLVKIEILQNRVDGFGKRLKNEMGCRKEIRSSRSVQPTLYHTPCIGKDCPSVPSPLIDPHNTEKSKKSSKDKVASFDLGVTTSAEVCIETSGEKIIPLFIQYNVGHNFKLENDKKVVVVKKGGMFFVHAATLVALLSKDIRKNRKIDIQLQLRRNNKISTIAETSVEWLPGTDSTRRQPLSMGRLVQLRKGDELIFQVSAENIYTCIDNEPYTTHLGIFSV